MNELFDRYRLYMSDVEDRMDHILGSRGRGIQIRDLEAFERFWRGICDIPALRQQWEHRLTEDSLNNQRNSFVRLFTQAGTQYSRGGSQKAA